MKSNSTTHPATLTCFGSSASTPILEDVFANFHHDGQEYDVQHLRPFTATYERPAKDGKPAETFSVNITFSHHCFTKGLPEDGTAHDPAMRYDVDGDPRLFNRERWELSKKLPEIVEKLPTLRCALTGKGNFFTVAITDADGTTVEYEIYFRVWKPGKGRISMHVESAYVRDDRATRPKGTSIAFFVILFNIKNERKIRG